MRTRLVARLGIAVITGLAIGAAVAGPPAWAHVEVSADKAQAGATDVTLTFTGEAESSRAGIASERVYLPAGITPSQVRLGSAPGGWTFTPEVDGFTVGGAPLPVGTDAQFSVVIGQLPANATELLFKTIETYGDGQIDRWIDEPQPGQAQPEHPAPRLELAAAAPGGSATPTSSASPTSAAPPASPTQTAQAQSTESGGNAVWWIVIAAVVIIAVVVAAVLLRRRRGPGAQ